MSWSSGARYAGYGLGFGFVLQRIGFSSFDETHRMFVFADLRMLLTFAGAVLIAAIGFVLTKKLGDPPRKPYHPGVILGGLIFGAGWAISGACPSIVMTQLGQGSMPALITLMGLLFGVWLHDKIKPKIFRFDGGSCEI